VTRSVNESDSVVIVTDFLTDVLGYNRSSGINHGVRCRSSFCDLAINLEGELRYLIEAQPPG
jgi:hypothetical protein